jgi:hypothetical protein
MTAPLVASGSYCRFAAGARVDRLAPFQHKDVTR